MIAHWHQSAATTESLKAACSVPCCSLSTPRIIVSVIEPFRNVHHAQYADDTQLYIALTTDKALGVINDCFLSVDRLLDANGLCLNPNKTEAIVIGTTARQRSEPQVDDVTVAGVTVPVTIRYEMLL